MALHRLMDTVRSGDKAVYRSFCRDLAEIRFNQDFTSEEVCSALMTLKEVALWVLKSDPEAAGLEQELENYIGMTSLFGCDQVEDTFESLRDARARMKRREATEHQLGSVISEGR